MNKSSKDLFLERVALRKKTLKEDLRSILKGCDEITLEIGSGHGDFLCAYADKFSQDFCLGLDILGPRLQKAQKKADKLNLSNIKFIKAEAQEFLDTLPEHIKLKAVFILFPDPWPKRKHFPNRLIQETFLDILKMRMTYSSRLYFRTDHREYFDWTVKKIQDSKDWIVEQQADWPFSTATRFEILTGGVYYSCVANCR